MAVLGTFGSFGIARLGIYASQSALTVTGNNIANINTTGYTRQYLSTSAMYVAGSDQLASGGSLNFGTGVSSDAIYQYRDIYMDIRYRDEATSVGEAETKLSGLQDLANILDEVASGEADFGVLEAQFSEIVQLLETLSEYTGSEEYDTLVRSACETLVNLFNSYADKLETVADNTLEEFQANIGDTNTILTNIRDLNEQIRNAEIYGDMALALRDQRNLYVDELSNLIGIDVSYVSEDIGLGVTVENMVIKIAGTDTELVNGIYCTQLNLTDTINMINPYINDDGTAYFDTSKFTNYMYVDLNGNPTNYADQAAPWLNPRYPDDDPDNPWISASGVPVDNIVLAGPQVNQYYWDSNAGAYDTATDRFGVPSPVAAAGTEPANDAGGWLGGEFAVGEWDAATEDWKKNDDGSYYVAYTTNDPNDTGIIQMNNNVDGDYDNAYLFTLSALTSSKGYYLKDDFNRDIKADILIGDTVMSGSLQAYRELLTEEGEYSSAYDIAMDSGATVKRGIPYYRMAMDSLANKFADTFNTLNSLNLNDIFAVNDDGQFLDMSAGPLLETDGRIMLDSNGNPMYDILKVDGVIVTIDNMEEYEDEIYEDGVRHPNYLTDDDGYFLEEMYVEGKWSYVPIQSEVGGVLQYDDYGEPVYISAANLTPENYAIVLDKAITQEVYAPDAMFSYSEKDDCFLDNNGNPLLMDGNEITLEDAMHNPAAFDFLWENGVLTEDYSNFKKSGNLFSNNSNNNDGTGITAANISISRDWSIGEVRIVLAKGENPGSTDNSNVLAFITAMDDKHEFLANDISPDAWTEKNEFFQGSFQEMFTNTGSTLAQDMNTTTTLLVNYENSLVSLDNARLSVSGVDLNEEASNMMQYQKAYVAAAKLMTTLDSVLETLLNM